MMIECIDGVFYIDRHKYLMREKTKLEFYQLSEEFALYHTESQSCESLTHSYLICQPQLKCDNQTVCEIKS